MKALTIWQPWASLIMIGAKPVEFRKWDYRQRQRGLEGQRIVIHAAKRPMRKDEILDLVVHIENGNSSLIADKALPLLRRIWAAPKCQGVVELSAGLGTAVIGTPRSLDGQFKKPDSDRLAHHMYGWPLSDIQPFDAPIPVAGLQGFWNWPFDASTTTVRSKP